MEPKRCTRVFAISQTIRVVHRAGVGCKHTDKRTREEVGCTISLKVTAFAWLGAPIHDREWPWATSVPSNSVTSVMST